MLIAIGAAEELRKPYGAGELSALLVFDATFINLDTTLLRLIVLYTLWHYRVRLHTCHNNTKMKIKLTRNICSVYQSRD